MPTHVVENQPPPLENYNLFTTDTALREAVAGYAPVLHRQDFAVLGELAGRTETIALGFAANEHPPELRTHDRFGLRIDEVAFHPAWHALLRFATQAGLAGAPWTDGSDFAHLRRAVKF